MTAWTCDSMNQTCLILMLFFPIKWVPVPVPMGRKKTLVFLLFRYYIPLEKGVALHLNKLESASPKDALCHVWLKLAQWFLRRRWKCEKFTDRRTDGLTTDNRWLENLTWAISSVSFKQNKLLSKGNNTQKHSWKLFNLKWHFYQLSKND